jgi:hypothetical protein
VLKTLELINYARVARVRVVPRVASRTLELINYARVARVRVVRVVASRTYKLRARSARSSRVRSLTGKTSEEVTFASVTQISKSFRCFLRARSLTKLIRLELINYSRRITSFISNL